MDKLPFIKKGWSGNMSFGRDNSNPQQLFLFGYFLVIIIFFIILALRVFQLTIVKGEYYRSLSEQNRIRELLIEPQRGKILDRKGFVITENKPADDSLKSARIYHNPEAIASLIGYEQIADRSDFARDNCLQKLKLGQKVGKKGVEKLFDCDLRGRYGKKLVEVDAKGQYLRTITVLPPQSGGTISLAFDWQLQKKAYDLLKDKKAAVIALAPKTGEVLLFLSTPSYNPQAFEEGNWEEINKYLESSEKPLFNRVTDATYPPGSIFKLVVATAALEEKAIDEKTQFEDTGILHAGALTFGNWYYLQYGKTEGMVDIIKAIRRSNDIFFYLAGDKAGPEAVKLWAERFGYGQATGIGFEEASGLVPSPFWKEETYHDRWYTGDNYNLSIGQGYLAVTPLQVTQVTSIFANNGTLCQPKLLKNDRPNCKKLSLSQKTIDLIREGMKQACSTGGTGWPLFNFTVKQTSEVKERSGKTSEVNIQTACKTGTAESQSKTSAPHAWFTVFAPFDDPQIALTVLIEEGGQGSDVAGPIAKEILKAYFERSE